MTHFEIFSNICPVCKCDIENYTKLCQSCTKFIGFIDQPYCINCGRSIQIGSGNTLCISCINNSIRLPFGRSIFTYNEYSKKIIMRLKKLDESIAEMCATLACTRYFHEYVACDVVVPVPMHFFKLLWRKFNHATLFAQYVALKLHLPLDNKILRCSRYTQKQSSKQLQERQNNVKNSFICKKRVSDKSILLIDDVLTSGATIAECSRVLLDAGAKEVKFLTICSVP